jgi:hypothetical protein
MYQIPICTKIGLVNSRQRTSPSSGGHSASGYLSGPGKQNVLLVMRDVLGREVYTKTLLEQSNGIFFLNLHNQLPSGVYFITASSDEKIVTKKVVVK